MKPLLCVRHQPTCPVGVLGDVFDAEQMPWQYLDAWREDSAPDLSEVSGLVVLGGEMNVDQVDRYPFLKTVRDLTKDAIEAGMPVLGVCLGAQVMARALGAEVTRSPIKEIGFVDVAATRAGKADPVLSEFAPRACVFQFHEDICALPEGAELLFHNEVAPVQAFKVGERAYGVQFHLEVTMAEIETWCNDTPNLERDWGVTKDQVVAQADALLEDQQQRSRDVARRFLGVF